MKLKYFWRVKYFDGSIIDQFRNNKELMWKEVDTSQVKTVSWMKKRRILPHKTAATIELEPGEKILICRRNHITPGRKDPVKVEYLLGKNDEYTIKII